jgi:hypothetical protein
MYQKLLLCRHSVTAVTDIQDKTDCSTVAVGVFGSLCPGYMNEKLRLDSWQSQEIFHWSIQPPVQLVLRAFSLKVKQVYFEDDHIYSFSAEVPLSASPCW